MVSIDIAMTAPARLTSDSMASERRPTEPVIRYATVLRPIVRIAAANDSTAKRTSEGLFFMTAFLNNGSMGSTVSGARTDERVLCPDYG